MLKTFEFTNFQSFEAEEGQPIHRIDLSQINLIYGPNSSGKSAIMRALRLIGANIKTHSLPSTNPWSFDVSDLRLGSYKNSVSRHEDDTRNMVFGFEFTKRIEIGDETAKKITNLKSIFTLGLVDASEDLLENAGHYGPGWFDLRFKINLVLTKPGRLSYVTFEVLPYVLDPAGVLGKGAEFAFRVSEIDGTFVWDFDEKEDIRKMVGSLSDVMNINDLLSQHRGNEGALDRINSDRFLGLDTNALEEWVELGGSLLWINDGRGNQPSMISMAFNEFNLLFETMWKFLVDSISHFDYVSPLREIPGVIQVKSSPLFQEIHTRTSFLKEIYGDEWVSQTLSKNGIVDFFEMPQEWFRRITRNEFDFVVEHLNIPGAGETYGLWAVGKTSKTSFENVGVGLSQVLPVLFAIFPVRKLGPDNSVKCVYLEQPELHLHPRMQGDLADAFIGSINSPFTSTQLFVETHSEALILRLLKRIREISELPQGEVTTDASFTSADLTINYVNKVDGKSSLTQARISSDGQMLDPWPLNFADLRINELFS
jgi:hypothetical protein